MVQDATIIHSLANSLNLLRVQSVSLVIVRLNSFQKIVRSIWLMVQLIVCTSTDTLTQNRSEFGVWSLLILLGLETVPSYGYISVWRKFLSLLGNPHLHQFGKWISARLFLADWLGSLI